MSVTLTKILKVFDLNANHKIGKISGVQIYLSGWFTAFFVPFVLTAALSMNFAPVAVFFLSNLSIVAHEMGHGFTARWYGRSLESITLYPFGGLLRIHAASEPPAGEEFWTAIAGPCVNFVICMIAAALSHATRWTTGGCEPIFPLFYWLATINLMIGLFNLLPAYPMDGGRILRSLLRKLGVSDRKATKQSAIVSIGVIVGAIPVLIIQGVYIGVVVLIVIATMAISNLRYELRGDA